MIRRIFGVLAASGLLAAASSSVGAPSTQDPPEALRHIEAARKLIGEDMKKPFFLCQPGANRIIGEWSKESRNWRKPAKLLDNLYFIGTPFVGTYIVKTSEGLVLFDALLSDTDIKDHLVPGLIELGLDPKSIRYVIATHAHWDHFGGSAYLQATYGARVGLSAADWDLIDSSAASTAGVQGKAVPKRDLVIADGQKLKLGDTTITLYITPGHTPGTVSALIPVRDKGKVKVFSLLGGTAFPSTLEGNGQTGGLKAFSASVERMGRVSRAAGAVGVLNTHISGDGGMERMDAVLAQGSTAPLLVGADGVRRYYGLFDECIKAAMARAAANPPEPGRYYQ